MKRAMPRDDQSSRWLRAGGFALALIFATLVALTGAPADEQLRLARDTLRAAPASGKIVIAEIDARSIDQLARWPWPRRIHADLIDQLRKAGAATIAFDVDLSSASNPADDAAMAAALARAGGDVILPTFRQKSSSQGHDDSENLPIPAFRDHAFLGAVNVQPDPDGQLRHYSTGTKTAGSPRPSIAALLAGSSGQIGSSFRVDTAIDPASIPRVSAIDILNGRIAPGALKGKSILIGATAIEMGDRYVVPGHGILPGVVVQVLAAETLLRGTTNPDFGPWPPLLFAIVAIGLIAWRRVHPAVTLAVAGIIAVAPLVLELTAVGSVQIVPALLFLALDAAALGAIRTQRKFAISRLTDAMTGLPNARALEKLCKRFETVTVIAISVVQFEEIDAVLAAQDKTAVTRQFIARLRLGFPKVFVHWVGPGTVALALPDQSPADLYDQVEAAGALFRAPVALGHRSVLLTPIFGLSAGAGDDASRLLAEARFAVRQAQGDGRRIAIHSDAVSTEANRSLTLLADIERALANDEITILFQPKWSIAEARVSGAEALVRWTHPALGPVSPEEFVPLFEANGQMRALTERVIDLCLAQLAEWAGNPLSLAINISAGLLDDHAFTDVLAHRLAALGKSARRITLEITESATVESTGAAVAALTRFREAGARISIDDYGTGHATLAYLKSFPADEIKIDKSFVTGMMTSNSDQIVVRSTIELAHELGFQVVAEGAEDADCLARLTQFGCDTVQGWVIGKPMRAAALLALTRDERMANPEALMRA